MKFKSEYLTPFGIKLVAQQEKVTLADIPLDLIHQLIKTHKLVLIRGLENISESSLIKFSKTIGALLAWDFGVVMEMRVHEKPKNYLFTHGHVPFHWDGAFHREPRYLMFNCVEAPLANSGGETLFANTSLIWQAAGKAEQHDWLLKKIRYKTEKLAHYGGEISVQLVQQHPDTRETILRFAERVPNTMLNPVEISIDDMTIAQAEQWAESFTQRCYLEKFCYAHTWQYNDILLADNFSLIHARRAFKQFSPRFLRRIQIL